MENFEIFEWGGKFWGQVCFIRDSGERIIFGAVLKISAFFGNLRVGGIFLGHVSFIKDSG